MNFIKVPCLHVYSRLHVYFNSINSSMFSFMKSVWLMLKGYPEQKSEIIFLKKSKKKKDKTDGKQPVQQRDFLSIG